MPEPTAEQDHIPALRTLWRDIAEKGIEDGVDYPRIVLTLFGDLDHAAEVVVKRDRELVEYVSSMERLGDSDIFTPDFLDGFRHALAMVAAYESGEAPSPDRAKREVREAARLVLSRMNRSGQHE